MSSGRNRDVSNIPKDPDDWLWSDDELKLADDYLDSEIDLNTDHDVPYTAGYSKDGLTVYIDKNVPQYLNIISAESRTKLISIDIWKTFSFHETVEKSLEAEPYFLPYQLAHQIALRAERAYVQSLGADWNDYNKKTLELVNEVGSRDEYPDCPEDLDLEPYEDEDDDETLGKMRSRDGRDFSAEEDADEGETDAEESGESGTGVEDTEGSGTEEEDEDEE